MKACASEMQVIFEIIINLSEVGDLSVLGVQADYEPGFVGVDVDAVHDGVLNQRLEHVLHGVDLHAVDQSFQGRLRVV